MTRLIALALSTAALIALPTTTANARDHHRNWSDRHDRDGKWDRHRHHDRYRSYSYRSYGYPYYGYAYPRTRTVISVGYPGYYGGYGNGYTRYCYGAYPGYGFGRYYRFRNGGYCRPGCGGLSAYVLSLWCGGVP
jgi:Ni/Co efflux regulator RcnB